MNFKKGDKIIVKLKNPKPYPIVCDVVNVYENYIDVIFTRKGEEVRNNLDTTINSIYIFINMTQSIDEWASI